MKKFIIFALIGASLLGFSACNTNKQSGVETTKASTVATEVEKDSVKSVVDEAIPTQKSGEYSISGIVDKKEDDTLVMETEKGSKITLPVKNIKIKLNSGDNFLITFKMNISDPQTYDDIEIVNVTKL